MLKDVEAVILAQALSRSLVPFVQDRTLVAVIELSLSSWLVAGVVPGVERQPLKKLEPDEAGLLRLLQRWRDEATKGGCVIDRITVAYEAGRDGFWLARWLRAYSDEIARVYRSQTARRSNLKARTIPVSNRPGWCRLVGRFRHVTGANSGSIYRRQRGLLFC
jgi:hypothetical protein